MIKKHKGRSDKIKVEVLDFGNYKQMETVHQKTDGPKKFFFSIGKMDIYSQIPKRYILKTQKQILRKTQGSKKYIFKESDRYIYTHKSPSAPSKRLTNDSKFFSL